MRAREPAFRFALCGVRLGAMGGGDGNADDFDTNTRRRATWVAAQASPPPPPPVWEASWVLEGKLSNAWRHQGVVMDAPRSHVRKRWALASAAGRLTERR